MNRKFRAGGSWDKRNGTKGLRVSGRFDFLNNALTDTVNLDTSLQQFAYTPLATDPVGSQTDTVNLDPSIVSFSYTP